MILRAPTLATGETADLRLEAGTIASVEPAGVLEPTAGEELHDLAGYLVLPSPVEPHAHLDKAFTADRIANPGGDLMGAVEAWIAYRPRIDVADARDRARAAALQGIARGVTAIRTHVDVGEGIELRSLEGLLAVREELEEWIHLELVALVSRPVSGPEGTRNRAFLREALELGADLVGGSPHVDPNPPAALDFCLETAVEFGRPVDLHMDETLDPDVLWLESLAARVSGGFPHPVTASHCVSLGIQPPPIQARVAEALAAAGVSVVACPQTNLYLQGRGSATSPPRALTAIRPLIEAGVVVAAGGDNVQDPFNPMGRADPLETANLLVTSGHLLPEDAYRLVSDGPRRVMGLPPVRVEPGMPADLLAIAASSVQEALASGTEDRMVFSGGRVVARTRVQREMLPDRTPARAAATSGGPEWP